MTDQEYASGEAQPFRITKPDEQTADQMVKELCDTDILRGGVQVIEPGGSNIAHSHSGQDGFWMALEGEATFYGKGDDVIEVLSENEGILIPRNLPYWFESTGDEDLVLLHVAAFSENTQEKTEHYDSRDKLDFAFYE